VSEYSVVFTGGAELDLKLLRSSAVIVHGNYYAGRSVEGDFDVDE